MIYADSREPKEVINLIRREGVPVQVQDIFWVDYIVAVGTYAVPVERKTAEDFVNSIVDGRIFNQTFMMSTLSPVSYVIVEGTPSVALFERKFPRKAYIGALVSLALKRSPYGQQGHVSVVVVDSYYDTALLLSLLHKQLEEGKLERLPKLSLSKKTLDKKAVLMLMLQAIPGVGKERAKLIADRFGSLQALIKATETEIAMVEGISINLAKKIKYYLT